jgi:hypothetical protein
MICEDPIAYKEIPTFKYELVEPAQFLTGIKGSRAYKVPFAILHGNGVLCIQKGYRWDGMSGPGIDTRNSIRGSLLHDAGYQLLRETLLSPSQRRQFDRRFYEILREDQMLWPRAQLIYRTVQRFGDLYTGREEESPTLYAPCNPFDWEAA